MISTADIKKSLQLEEYKPGCGMENYKSTADLRSSSCLLLKLLNGIKKGVKWVKSSFKFIVWIEVDYLLLLLQLNILTLLIVFL